jgi:hypothetical protein
MRASSRDLVSSTSVPTMISMARGAAVPRKASFQSRASSTFSSNQRPFPASAARSTKTSPSPCA